MIFYIYLVKKMLLNIYIYLWKIFEHISQKNKKRKDAGMSLFYYEKKVLEQHKACDN